MLLTDVGHRWIHRMETIQEYVWSHQPSLDTILACIGLTGLYPSFVGYYTNWIYKYKPVSPIPVAIICSHAHALKPNEGQIGNHPSCGQPIFAPYPFLLCSATLILLFPMSIVFHCIPFRQPTQIPLPSVSMYDLANISLLTTT